MSRILVIGVPRSGTSWVARILSSAPGAVLIDEPDYPETYPTGGLAVEQLGEYPVLAPDSWVRRYELMWDVAFSGGFPDRSITRRLAKLVMSLPQRYRQPLVLPVARALPRVRTPPEHCIVKTVHAQFALDWIVARYEPQVVVVRRNLLSVVASWLQLGFVPYDVEQPVELAEHDVIRREFLDPLSLHPPARSAPVVHQIAWHVGLLSLGLERAVARHPDWVVVEHEQVCDGPSERFRELFSRLGMSWTDAVEREIARLDAPGGGVEVRRIARDQIESWKVKLDPEQVVDATRVLRSFSRFSLGLGVGGGGPA